MQHDKKTMEERRSDALATREESSSGSIAPRRTRKRSSSLHLDAKGVDLGAAAVKTADPKATGAARAKNEAAVIATSYAKTWEKQIPAVQTFMDDVLVQVENALLGGDTVEPISGNGVSFEFDEVA